MKVIDYSMYLIADTQYCTPEKILENITPNLLENISVLQLRMKNLNTQQCEALSRKIQMLLEKQKIPLIINDHVDIAIDVDAVGVHIGQEDGAWQQIREKIGEDKIIGLSIENIAQAKKLAMANVDYFGVGPIFKTHSKSNVAPTIGIEQLTTIRNILNKPIVAIGGVSNKNLKRILATGVNGIAVISAIWSDTNPTKACYAMLAKIRGHSLNTEE